MRKVLILIEPSWITLFYKTVPFRKIISKDIKITTNLNRALNNKSYKHLIIVRVLSRYNKDQQIELIKKLKKRFESVSLFQDNDGPHIYYPFLLEFLDYYFVSDMYQHYQIIDGNYLDYNQLNRFSAQNLGLNKQLGYTHISKDNFKKIHLAWNLAFGIYPRQNFKMNGIRKFSQHVFYINWPFDLIFHNRFKNRDKKRQVHAIFGNLGNEMHNYQRHVARTIINNHPLFLTEKVKTSQFYKSLSQSKLAFSPFGYGEVCFRDFEIIKNKALLIKPSMNHIKTHPDVYIPYETYIPVKWDLSDLIEVVEKYIDNDTEIERITNNATKLLEKYLNNQKTDALAIINRILNKEV